MGLDCVSANITSSREVFAGSVPSLNEPVSYSVFISVKLVLLNLVYECQSGLFVVCLMN